MIDRAVRIVNRSAPFVHTCAVCTAVLMTALFLFSTGCQSTYYAVWEKMGKEKRHLLKNNVEKVREDQAAASEQFATVVERIKAMYGFDGDLENIYTKLSQDYRACEERADAVRGRIDKVERIAADLFKEWESEITAIDNPEFRSKSRASLKDTRSRFARLQRAMTRAETSMDPVLSCSIPGNQPGPRGSRGTRFSN